MTHRVPLRTRSLFLLSLFVLVFVSIGLAADESAHTTELRPITELTTTLQLDALAELPVQHGGRYKPLHALGMEIMDGINGGTTLGPGHTPLTSLLDLAFCRSAYNELPIAVVKHDELRRDLGLLVPANERAALLKDGHITPARLDDETVEQGLEDLSRLTAKTKAINQVRLAHANLDVVNILAQMRLFAVPDGPHSDRWRSPAEIAAPFADTLADFLRDGRAAHGALDAYARTTWNVLPLSGVTAARLRISEEDARHANLEVWWPLWRLAGEAALPENFAADLIARPEQTLAALSLSVQASPVHSLKKDEQVAIAEAIDNIAKRWQVFIPVNDDVADPLLLPSVREATAHAARAWNDLGHAWSAARLSTTPAHTNDVQQRIDALVATVTILHGLLNRDRQARSLPPLAFDTHLEMTYWRWHGFSSAAWAFLFAVPALALGAVGRQRIFLWLGFVLFTTGFGGQIAAFIVRAILAQRIPLANLYESMAAAALVCSLIAAIAEIYGLIAVARAKPERQPHTFANGSLAMAASLFGCIIVLAQVFLERHDINAFISPQMPILSEFWLRIHTSCVVSSYGLIGLGGLMSVSYLCMRIWLPWDDARVMAWDRTTFAINAAASVVLWIGLCLGAVWAAVSWGRPWGWDPKEVFALLTWVVFIALVHLRLATTPRQRGLATALVSLGAMLVMIFNWYWVNVQLAGLHSYA